MTVGELIEELRKHDPQAKVEVTWEGVLRDLGPENIYVAAHGSVLIDGDNNDYKESWTSDPDSLRPFLRDSLRSSDPKNVAG